MNSVAIVGRGRHWQKAYKDTARHVWAVSSVFHRLPRVDKVFNVHANPATFGERLEAVKEKLVVACDVPGFEECERLPVRELVQTHGPNFSSSVSWMLAYAGALGYTSIGLFGIDMFASDEFHHQRDGLYFLWGQLTARGIKVYAPEQNGVYLKPQLYGIEE